MRERLINRIREWESQFWLLFASALVIVYLNVRDFKGRLKGRKGAAQTKGPNPGPGGGNGD